MRLSAVLITKNEEADLPGCLESLKGLDAEIVVVDGGSTDATVSIASRVTPHVHSQRFDSYAAQKQAALDKASGDWVLSIDADERVTPELNKEIRAVLQNGNANGSPAAYQIPFEVHFMDRRLRFGGLGGEKHIRLFRRGAGRFVGGLLHEGIAVVGPVGKLSGKIVHTPYRDVGEYLDKMRAYTDYAARKRQERGTRFTPLHHLLPAWEFFVRAILKLGFLDGTPGLVWAGLSSFHTWVKYVKLRELSQEARKSWP